MKSYKVIILICGVSLIGIGLHSIDLWFNFHNLAVADMTIGNVIVPIDELYSDSFKTIIFGVILLILANFINNND